MSLRRRGGPRREQQSRVATAGVPRPEETGVAERRRLEHRVQSRGVESSADERDVGERVEIAEHADAVDEHDVGAPARAEAPSRAQRDRLALAPPLDRREVRRRRLVRRDDQSRLGMPLADAAPRAEQHAARPTARSSRRRASAVAPRSGASSGRSESALPPRGPTPDRSACRP